MSVAGKADEKGQYKISPNPGIRFGVTAYPPDGSPYLARELEPIDWKSGDRSREVDVKLPRGVLVRGQVLEQGSNKPIVGASVQYHAEDEKNPSKSEGILTGWQDIHLTDAQGHFEMVVLSGPGRLMIHAPENEFVFQETSERELYSGHPGGPRNYAHAIERIEPEENSEPLELTVHLTRGATVRGELVDTNGAPIKSAAMFSRLHIFPSSPSCAAFPIICQKENFRLVASGPTENIPFISWTASGGSARRLPPKPAWKRPRVVLKPVWRRQNAVRRRCRKARRQVRAERVFRRHTRRASVRFRGIEARQIDGRFRLHSEHRPSQSSHGRSRPTRKADLPCRH